MAGLRRKPTPQERAKLAPFLEGLVRRLFEPSDQVFFERPQVPEKRLEEFAKSEQVQEATFDYVEELVALWLAGRYGKPLKVMARKNLTQPVVEKVVMPEFADPSERRSLGPDHEQAVAAMPAAAQSEASTMPQKDPPESQMAPAAGAENSKRRSESAVSAAAALRPGQVPSATASAPKAPERTASFNLPNAKVGAAYDQKIQGRDAQGRAARVLEMQLPEGLGLTFDAESGELRGAPQVDGDHRIPLRWTLDGGAAHPGECLLIVNPDPRSLWKVVEPPADAPYSKPHIDALALAGDGCRVAAASRRGRSHEHAGSFRDDDFYLSFDSASGWGILLVADGAGSAQYSRQGSLLAVTAAGEHLTASLAGDLGAELDAALGGWDADPAGTTQTLGTQFHYLFHKAGQLAVHAIEHEAQARGAAPRDYATTLLAAVVKRQGDETFLATFWMGDGAIAAYGPRGKVRLMGTPDGGEFAGQTRFLDRASLSDQGFAKRVGIGRFQGLSGVLIMTDGVSDPRFETDNGLADPARWDALWDELAPILEADAPEQGLADWLSFFSPGHHDDRTLALLW